MEPFSRSALNGESSITGSAEVLEVAWRFVKPIDRVNAPKRRLLLDSYAGLLPTQAFPSQILPFMSNMFQYGKLEEKGVPLMIQMQSQKRCGHVYCMEMDMLLM